jgi:hypothetical protein
MSALAAERNREVSRRRDVSRHRFPHRRVDSAWEPPFTMRKEGQTLSCVSQ